MRVELLDEIGWTAISLIASPTLWLALLVSWVIGIRRVKRERGLFRSRTHGKRSDVLETLLPGLLVGLVLSIVSGWLGLTLTPQYALLLLGLSSVLLLVGIVRLNLPLWPIFLLGLTGWFLMDSRLDSIRAVEPKMVLLLATLTLVAECLLVWWRGQRRLSPSLVVSKRGRFIGGLSANKLWLLPLLVFVPGDVLEAWWPRYSFPELVPIVLWLPIGFSFLFTGKLPKELMRPLVQGRLITSLVAILLTVLAYVTGQAEWLYGIVLLLVLHIVLHQRVKRLNRAQTPLFLNGTRGAVILGTLPDKPAAEMGLIPGEAIYKVNGEKVDSEASFYEAIQKHKPYLRLEVMNHNGDIRFAQRAFYEQDHHELGILFVNEPVHGRTKVRSLH